MKIQRLIFFLTEILIICLKIIIVTREFCKILFIQNPYLSRNICYKIQIEMCGKVIISYMSY